MAEEYENEDIDVDIDGSDDYEVDIVDDTPEEDRGRTKLADDGDDDDAE